jgi:transposase
MNTDNTIQLRSQISRYKTFHSKIKSQLSEERLKHKQEIKKLKEDFKSRESVFKDKISSLQGQLVELKQKVFGKSSESHYTDNLGVAKKKFSKRNRGQQPGSKGHGRKKDVELPTDEVILSLPDSSARCDDCGLPFKETSLHNSSEEITYEVILRKKR